MISDHGNLHPKAKGAREPGTLRGPRYGPGRPVGGQVRVLVDGDAEEIIQKAIAMAKRGDPIALRLMVERILPAKKHVPFKIKLPEKLATASDISAALSAVIAHMSKGELAPEEALQVGALLEQKRKCIEMTELEARMAAIEEKMER